MVGACTHFASPLPIPLSAFHLLVDFCIQLRSTGEKWDQSDMHHVVPYQAQLFPPPVTHHLFVSITLFHKRKLTWHDEFFVVLKEFLFYVKMDLVKIHFFINHFYPFMWNIQISQCLPVAGATFFIGNQPLLYACVHTGMDVCKKNKRGAISANRC